MTVRRGLAALALLPLALAGCSSGSSTGTAGSGTGTGGSSSTTGKTAYELCDKPGAMDKDALLAAKSEPTKTTAHIDGSMDMATPGGAGGGATTGATGASSGMPLVGDIDGRDPANPKVKLTMGGAGGGPRIEMIMVDKVMYMNMGQMTGNKYVKLTMDDLAKQSGVDLNQLSDPTAQLAKAKDAIVKVTCKGREDVGGTQAAHVVVTMDSAKMMEAAKSTATTSGSGSGTGTAGATSLPSGVPATMDTQMWVASDNRPLKVMSGTDQATMTMTYSKWGEPVTIQAPPTASVTEMPGASGTSGGGSGSKTATGSPSAS